MEFETLIEEAFGLTDAEIDQRVRANELELRRLQAEQAVLIAVAGRRGVHLADQHRSMTGYLRAHCNYSTAEASRKRLIAEVCDAVPVLGDALLRGRIGVAQVLEIARIHGNPRTRPFFARVAPIYLQRAEHASHGELHDDIGQFIELADQDGSFAELACNIELRTAGVHVVDGTLDMRVTGGDPIVADEVVATFEWFLQKEFERDVADRSAEHGDAAAQFPLARTDRQRRFDAIVSMVRAARAYGDGATPADVVVNVVSDPRTLTEALAEAEVIVADPDSGEVTTIELDDGTIDTIIAAAGDDPARWVDRRCATSSGTPIHPKTLLQAAMTGYVRRVIIDSQGTVVDWGRKRRLFTGPAREAAKLLARRCQHPGCTVSPRFADVDHADEWSRGGATDQRNANIECRSHNRFKSRARWRIRRDETGRNFSIRPDGTVVLPVGAREPDFTDDDMSRMARARLAEFVAERDAA
jgi:hypothetical protein